jgi:hypothetical protein
MKITFAIRDTLDRRTTDQQHRYDELVERAWRQRVAYNPKERVRLQKQWAEDLPGILRRQA